MKLAHVMTAFALAAPSFAVAQERLGPDPAALAAAREKGAAFLKTTQAEDGSWSSPDAIGITALATQALMSAGLPQDDPAVAAGLAKIAGAAQEDGRISTPNSRISGYETSVAVVVLSEADAEKYAPIVKKAEAFLRGMQFDEEDGVESGDVAYGGVAYGPGGGRPDLSNTAYLIEALRAAGAGEDDPAIQKALTFVSRCQNLESEYNRSETAAAVNDGGFFYNPVAEVSAAGRTPQGGLRSYGSMTYAGLKSMVYAGLDQDDPRVRAALDWIGKNYTVQQNPGMGDAGLYYYYQLFGKALDAADVARLTDESGAAHDWRGDLAERLFALQKPNGSWVNDNERWMEGDPSLATAFALLALDDCDPPTAE
ncbi:prenyltransferase/squalene oxidase repeat-containing protein [Alienimonas sp. DA493]|uniref:prenyltransferase/squalene oxidase repeat-containing protein n=1 Tax=Alienimonas sp. DA493 TaxID=3373605 RepID=UPI0037549DFF